MSCTNTGPFDGGTWNDSTFVNPTIMGGTAINTELSGANLTGSVQIDDNVAQQLAAFLCPYVAECVSFSAEEIAAVFKDCHGSAHVPDAQIPTCTEMDTAIEEATKPVVATTIPSVTDATDEVDLPTIIVGKQRDQLLGRPDAWLKWGDYLIPAYVAE